MGSKFTPSLSQPAVSQPVGAVIQYAGPVDFDAPGAGSASYPRTGQPAYRLALERQGWLVCDGSLVAIARYPKLFRVIGWLYGTPPEEKSGWFYLPDYRGRVLRGVNGTATAPLGPEGEQVLRDPQAPQRSSQEAGGWTGNAVGTVQEDALQNHLHGYQAASEARLPSSTGTGGVVGNQPAFTDAPTPATSQEGAVRTAPETRPKNQGVHMLIRAW